MVESNIIRDATVDEKKEWIEIGKEQTIEQRFALMVAKQESICTKKHIPFARRWAYDDFNDKKDELLKEYERKFGVSGTVKIDFEDFKIDWAKYSDTKNFVLLDESEVVEDKLLDGMRQPITTGKWQNFQVKGKKYRISVFVPRFDEATGKKVMI